MVCFITLQVIIFLNQINSMLTEEKIKENYERFSKALEVLGEPHNELMQTLGVDIIVSPASLSTDKHGAYKGGLIEHILEVSSYAYKINQMLPKDKKVSDTSLIKVSFLHLIGNSKIFKPLESDWHNKKGIMYEFINDKIAMSTGERSLKLAIDAGVEFSDEEYQAMLNFGKPETDTQAKYFTEMLGEIIKMANTLAIKTKQ